jgi:hypothetical protein
MRYDSLVPFLKASISPLILGGPKRPVSGWKMGDKARYLYLEDQVTEGRMLEEAGTGECSSYAQRRGHS